MIKDLFAFYSKSAQGMQRSEIRELLKVTRKPEIISFAGGLPAPETFPVKEIQEICCNLLSEKGATALQYGPTEGETPLREEIAKWLARHKPGIHAENILIMAGSQQGLDVTAKIFIDPGDIIIVELPTYIGGLQAFNAYRAKMIGVPQDEHGMRIDKLEKALARLAARRKTKIYLCSA